MADNIDKAAFSNMNTATADSTGGMFKDDYNTRSDWLEGLMNPKRELESLNQRYRRDNPDGTGNIRDVDYWDRQQGGEGASSLVMANMGWSSENKYGIGEDELNKLFDLESVQFGKSGYKEGVDTSKEYKEYDTLRQDLLTRDY